jgi:hypothetical protein
MHATKCIQDARKWLDQAMYYTGDPMPYEDFRKVREAYDLICSANDKL